MEDPLYNFSNDNTFGLEGTETNGTFDFGQGQVIVRDTGIQMNDPLLDVIAVGGLDLAQDQEIIRNTEIILPTKCLPPEKLKTVYRYVGDVNVNYGGNYFDEGTNFNAIQNQEFNDNVYNAGYDLPNQVTNDQYSQDVFSNQPVSEPFTEDVYGDITNTHVLDGLEDSGTPVSYDVPTTFNKIPYTPEVTTPITFTEQVLPTTKIISTNTEPLVPTEVYNEPLPTVTLQPTTVTQVYKKPLVATAPIVTQPPPVVTTTTTPVVTTSTTPVVTTSTTPVVTTSTTPVVTTSTTPVVTTTTTPVVTTTTPIVSTTAPIITTTPVVSTTQVIPTPTPTVIPKTQIVTLPATTSGIASPRPTTVVAAPKPVQVIRPVATVIPPVKPVEFPPVKPVEFPPAKPIVQTALPKLVATTVVPRRPSTVVGARPIIGTPVLQSRPVIGAPVQALATLGGVLPSRPLVGRPSMPAPARRSGYLFRRGLSNYKSKLYRV